jgi:transcriptional regulator with XRE-family HTH domain
MHVGERLQQLREAQQMSQRDLERLAHLPRTAVSKMENGTRKMEAVELKALSVALRVPLDAFFGAGTLRPCTPPQVPVRRVKRTLRQIATAALTLSATLDNL